MYTIDCDALAELPPAERLAEWERIARDVEQESVRERGRIVLAEIEAQTQAHGEWGARRRAAQALGLSPQRLSHMADRAETNERARLTTQERTITLPSGTTRTWRRTVTGEGTHHEVTGWWATTTDDGTEWVVCASEKGMVLTPRQGRQGGEEILLPTIDPDPERGEETALQQATRKLAN